MRYIKLFEEWNEIYEGIPSQLMSDIALFNGGSLELKAIEDQINKTVGDNAEVSVESKPVSQISFDNKEVEKELKSDSSVKSVIIIDVKDNNAKNHKFIVPQKKDSIKVDKSGVISLPTLMLTKDDAIDVNIGGFRTIMNDLAKGKDFDENRISAKISVKHRL